MFCLKAIGQKRHHKTPRKTENSVKMLILWVDIACTGAPKWGMTIIGVHNIHSKVDKIRKAKGGRNMVLFIGCWRQMVCTIHRAWISDCNWIPTYKPPRKILWHWHVYWRVFSPSKTKLYAARGVNLSEWKMWWSLLMRIQLHPTDHFLCMLNENYFQSLTVLTNMAWHNTLNNTTL